ncbi:DUF2637 domain-containing protein [Cellulosimicrobium cellulans]|uniref:DUF2637 domain-containing protein n=1 Tax=Cellulosimicrobium cellulans TaxID=1710 RepID=UPI000314E1A6|nr:DUF2637 domain-containing protein [Cellulosimicrobium cellulans]
MSKRSKTKSEPGRLTANLGVGVVAITAAVISFTHVQHLAQEAGETDLAALLLPLSVDGAIAAPAAVILAESKAKRRPPRLAWVMLILGLIASLGANIASAEPTLTARLIAAWPPIALALGIEVIAAVSRRAREDREAVVQDQTADAARPNGVPTAAAPVPQSTAADRPAAPVEQAPAPVLVQPGPQHPTVQTAAASAQAPVLQAEQTPASVGGPQPITDQIPAQAQTDRQPGPVAARAAAASAGPQRSVRATARTGHARRPALEISDDDAIELIRRLDAESDSGPVSRRTIETALVCGATRATRLAALARAVDRVPELVGQTG